MVTGAVRDLRSELLPAVKAELGDILELKDKANLILVTAEVQGDLEAAVGMRKLRGKRIMLALGSESDGLTPEFANASDYRVRLSHSANVESLNVTVAGSILMNMIATNTRQ